MLVTKKDSGKLYAMKVLKKEELAKRNQREHTQNERDVLAGTRDHPFIVQLRFAFQTADKLYIVMDFMRGGELFFHLRKSGRFTESRA
jgi:serine/threonine protein kinase